MNYIALKPINFGGTQYKIGDIIPEGVVNEQRSLFLKKSGHIAEAANIEPNGGVYEVSNEELNKLSIPLLQSKHELVINSQQLLQFFSTIQKTADEAKQDIESMEADDMPVLELLHEIDSRKGVKTATETRMSDLKAEGDSTVEEDDQAEVGETEQPEGGEENEV